MRRTDRLVTLANTKIPIERVLKDLFKIDVPPDAGGWKCECPLGYDHSDGGRTKAMKVYSASNTAWCFSHSRKFTPVSLWQIATDKLSRVESSKEILAYYGIDPNPPSLDARWEATHDPHSAIQEDLFKSPQEIKEFESETSVSIIVGTFLSYLRSVPDYPTRQYEAPVMDTVNKILDGARSFDSETTYATLEAWLNESKRTFKFFWIDYNN